MSAQIVDASLDAFRFPDGREWASAAAPERQ
jgi:hypothetical protein